jgi:hypothetical protein
VHMHNRHFVVSMTISGEKTPAFSAISLNLPPQQADYSAAIADNSRALYASSREYVERYINDRHNLDAYEAPIGLPEASTGMAAPRPGSEQLVVDVAPTAPAPESSQLVAPISQPAEPQLTSDGTLPAKPKRKRTRRKKSKPVTTNNGEPKVQPTGEHIAPRPKQSDSAEVSLNSAGETVIHLK